MFKLNVGADLYLKGRIGWRGLSKNEYLAKGEYKIINATALMDGYVDWDNCGYITKERYEESEEIMLKENDILISKDGTLGKIGYVKGLTIPTTVASGVFVLRNTKQDELNFDYLYHVLKSYIFKDFINRNKAQGSTINHLYQRDLEKFELELPDKKIQDKIALILNNIDNKIELNNKSNSELENLAKTLYEYYFNQFEFPNEEGKPYKSSGCLMKWNDEIQREIPQDWNIHSLHEFCNVNEKNITSSTRYEYINYLDTSNITSNKIDEIQELNCDTDKIPSRAKRIVSENDIVYSTVRPKQNHHGLIKNIVENMIVSTGFTVISHSKDKLINDAIYVFITQKNNQELLQTIAETSVSSYPSINPDDIMNLKMIIPEDLDTFKRLSEKIHKIYNMIAKKQKENKELESLRDWLLPMLMNGQLSFKNLCEV